MKTLLLCLTLLLSLSASAFDNPKRHSRRWYARHIAKRQKLHQQRTAHTANKVSRRHF